MGLFDAFKKGNNFEDGINEAKNTQDAVLLDVRTPAEYAGGHVPGSINLPAENISSITIDKNKPLFVYCLSGGRSQRACMWLKENGYNAKNIGGIGGYGGPLEK